MINKSLIQTIKAFIDILPQKQKEIVEKRYGLDGSSPLTLEAIGKEKNLTRERIRQIENQALLKLRQNLNELNDILERIKYQLEVIGGIRREKRVLEEFSALFHNNPSELWQDILKRKIWENHINFLLDLSPQFNYFIEKPDIHSNWYLHQKILTKTISIHKFTEKEIRNYKRPLMLDEYQMLLRKIKREFRIKNENLIISYLDLSKQFAFNFFNEFGLVKWESICPRNIGNKAFLILKKMGRPLHFEEIFQKIKEIKFDDKKVSINSLHNELIKNEKFVLVGRGTYALREWGYKSGTVKDILVEILAKKPMFFKDLLKEIAKQRLVKDMTVFINLQDKNLFRKLPDGRYSLVKR